MRLADLLFGKVELHKEEPSPQTVRKAQLVMLEIMEEIHRICERHGLRYWIDSGTLLGAVRHKGFIPWDDDLDINMPIEDYYTFLEIAPVELPEGMFLQTKKLEPAFDKYFAKVRSLKGRVLEERELRRLLQGRRIKYNTGIYVDIFPCITIKEQEKNLHLTLIKGANRIRKALNVALFVDWLFTKVDAFLHEGWEREDLIVVRSCRFPEESFAVPVKSIFPLRLYEFEGKKFWGPKDFDTYLRILYGNYMKLPPVNERHTHAYVLEVFE